MEFKWKYFPREKAWICKKGLYKLEVLDWGRSSKTYWDRTGKMRVLWRKGDRNFHIGLKHEKSVISNLEAYSNSAKSGKEIAEKWIKDILNSLIN